MGKRYRINFAAIRYRKNPSSTRYSTGHFMTTIPWERVSIERVRAEVAKQLPGFTLQGYCPDKPIIR